MQKSCGRAYKLQVCQDHAYTGDDVHMHGDLNLGPPHGIEMFYLSNFKNTIDVSCLEEMP